MFKCLVEASSDKSTLTCVCVPFPPSQVAEANVASNERAKRSKKKKKMEDGPGKVLLDSTPSRIYPFSHYICFLLFVFCLVPYRVLYPRIPEENRNTAPRGREGGAHSGVHFLLESNSPFERNGFRRPGAELICALYRDCFLCKCYSSFCVLADIKTHFKITERT